MPPAATAVYPATRELCLAQRFARRVSPLTTVMYTHASYEGFLAGVRELDC